MADKDEQLDNLLEEEAETQPKEEAKAEPEAPEPEKEPESPMVPLKALHEERDRRKEDSKRLEQLEKELEALKTPPKAEEPAKAPDMFEDPEGYNAYWEKRLESVQQSNQQQLINERLNISERYAVKEHGEDTVKAAQEWFAERVKQNPGFQAEVITKPDPYEFAIQEFKREQLSSRLMADPDKLNRILELLEQQQEPQAQPQAPTTTANARSVARRAPEPFDTDEALEDILSKS